MVEIYFTYRPLSFRPISFINMITRIIQGHPRDHVAIVKDGIVYESAFRLGVNKTTIDLWKADRLGTDCIIYSVPEEDINFEIFDKLEGTKYDTRAAILHLFGREERLIRRPFKAINCSELAALMLGMDRAYKATPEDVELYLRSMNYPLKTEKVRLSL